MPARNQYQRARAARVNFPSPTIPLKPFELLFLNAYLTNGQNATRAYLAVRPATKYTSAEACARKVLGRARVKAELARRVQYGQGITEEFVHSGLLHACALADATKDSDKIRNAYMDCAKLAGFLVEKREVSTVNPEHQHAVRILIRRMLTPTRSTASEECPSSDKLLNSATPTPSGPSLPAPVTDSSSETNGHRDGETETTGYADDPTPTTTGATTDAT